MFGELEGPVSRSSIRDSRPASSPMHGSNAVDGGRWIEGPTWFPEEAAAVASPGR